tara:strand:+ start:253 stop:579 length:327 start_codon:yes stop_codon:yes gene_type:complete
MQNQSYLVQRGSDSESTVAIVRAEFDSSDADTFLEALKKAVTTWTKTEIGFKAWEDSCEDFNIGDLENEDFSEGTELHQALVDKGIDDLSIETISTDNHSWKFDTTLR